MSKEEQYDEAVEKMASSDGITFTSYLNKVKSMKNSIHNKGKKEATGSSPFPKGKKDTKKRAAEGTTKMPGK